MQCRCAIALSCAAGMFLIASPSVLGQGSIVSRMLLADPVPSALGTFAVDIYVQARVIDDPTAINIGAMEYDFTDDDPATVGVPFSPAPLTIGETVPGLTDSTPDPLGRAGMFPKYRSTIGNPGNGRIPAMSPETWVITPLTLSTTDTELIDNEWSGIYELRWTTDDLSTQTVRVDATSTVGGYRVPSGTLIQPVPSIGSSIEFTVPAPSGGALAIGGMLVAGRRRR